MPEWARSSRPPVLLSPLCFKSSHCCFFYLKLDVVLCSHHLMSYHSTLPCTAFSYLVSRVPVTLMVGVSFTTITNVHSLLRCALLLFYLFILIFRKDRYDPLRICLGDEVVEKLANTKLFMVRQLSSALTCTLSFSWARGCSFVWTVHICIVPSPAKTRVDSLWLNIYNLVHVWHAISCPSALFILFLMCSSFEICLLGKHKNKITFYIHSRITLLLLLCVWAQ